MSSKSSSGIKLPPVRLRTHASSPIPGEELIEGGWGGAEGGAVPLRSKTHREVLEERRRLADAELEAKAEAAAAAERRGFGRGGFGGGAGRSAAGGRSEPIIRCEPIFRCEPIIRCKKLR